MKPKVSVSRAMCMRIGKGSDGVGSTFRLYSIQGSNQSRRNVAIGKYVPEHGFRDEPWQVTIRGGRFQVVHY